MVDPEVRSFDPGRLIDLQDERHIRYWTQRFKATPEELERAVKEVGENAVAVSIWMGEPLER